jgi:hypothetical protein
MELSKFRGFGAPESNFVSMPLELITALPLFSTLAELKVVLYILRHTWGYQEFEEGKRITLDEFEHGRKRRDGTRIDNGVGMVKSSIVDGLARAADDGFIVVEKDDTDLARSIRYYSLAVFENQTPDVQLSNTGVPEIKQRTEIDTLDKEDLSDADATVADSITLPEGAVWWKCADDTQWAHIVLAGRKRPACKRTPWRYPSQLEAGLPRDVKRLACPFCVKTITPSKPVLHTPQPWDCFIDAIARIAFGATDRESINAKTGRVVTIVHGSEKMHCVGLITFECNRQGKSKQELDFQALAGEVPTFWDWYRAGYPDKELKDCNKWLDHWSTWRTEQRRNAAPVKRFDAACPNCHGGGLVDYIIEAPGVAPRLLQQGEDLSRFPQAKTFSKQCDCRKESK